MARPVVSAAVERMYSRLPLAYAKADATAEGDWPLLRFLSLVGDQLGEVEVLFDRINFLDPASGGAVGDTSDLTDPLVADEAWLPWLAQLVGAHLGDTGTITAKRDAVLFAPTGWLAGTKTALADAVRSVLTGSKYVGLFTHVAGDPWKVEIRTRAAESPGPAAVAAAIAAKRAKPAGVELTFTDYSATWDMLEASYPTSDAWDAKTWDQLENTS